MSRFYDRLMACNGPLTLYDLVDIDKYRTTPHSGYQKIRDAFRDNPNVIHLAEDSQTGGTGMVPDIWEKAKVYAVDNVHHYLEAHNVTGEDLVDMVKPLATVPSHEYMFIESRWSAAPNGSRAYGWFVSRMVSTEPGTRWQLQALLFVEWEKGRPLGPFVILTWYLDEEGRQVSRPGDPPLTEDMSTPEAPGAPGLLASFCEAVMYEMALARCVLAFSLGLLHCKNVSEIEHQPSAKLQKAFQRRHRRPLTYYSTVDITPVSRAIDQTIAASGASLPKALHMCRGHFKTYRPEAPLSVSSLASFGGLSTSAAIANTAK